MHDLIELLIFVKSSQLGIFVSNYQEIDKKIYLGGFLFRLVFANFDSEFLLISNSFRMP